MRLPTIYRYEGRIWHGGFDRVGTSSLFREFFWMLRYGRWDMAWNWPQLVFGLGRTWYDGPIWHANLGIWSVSLTVE